MTAPDAPLADLLDEAARIFGEPCRYCGHPDILHAVEGRTVGCQAGDGSESNPICGCRKLRGEESHEMGDPRAPHPDPYVVGFALAHLPRLVRVARAAVEMREAVAFYFGRHSIESDADHGSTRMADATARFDAAASAGEGKTDE